jgi:hypothetical protein
VVLNIPLVLASCIPNFKHLFERTSFPTTMVKMTRFLRLPLLPVTREINGYAI